MRGAGNTVAVCLHSRQWDFGQRDGASLRRIRGGDGAAVTNIGISELESGHPVVLLLHYHAIETDHAWAGVRDGRIPYAQSVAAASRLSTGTNRFTECGDKTYLSAIIP